MIYKQQKPDQKPVDIYNMQVTFIWFIVGQIEIIQLHHDYTCTWFLYHQSPQLILPAQHAVTQHPA